MLDSEIVVGIDIDPDMSADKPSHIKNSKKSVSKNHAENKKKAKSPCINVCRLNSESVCSGCYRSLDEIGHWSSATNDEQLLIVDKALERRAMLETNTSE